MGCSEYLVDLTTAPFFLHARKGDLSGHSFCPPANRTPSTRDVTRLALDVEISFKHNCGEPQCAPSLVRFLGFPQRGLSHSEFVWGAVASEHSRLAGDGKRRVVGPPLDGDR